MRDKRIGIRQMYVVRGFSIGGSSGIRASHTWAKASKQLACIYGRMYVTRDQGGQIFTYLNRFYWSVRTVQYPRKGTTAYSTGFSFWHVPPTVHRSPPLSPCLNRLV